MRCCRALCCFGTVRHGEGRLRPAPATTAQDPNSLVAQMIFGTIPATPKKQTRACWVCSVSVLRRRQDEPAGGHLTQDDARKAAHRTTRARDPPSPLSEATPRTPRRRRSARRPKNADERTGPDSTQRDMASAPHIEARHLEVPRASSHRGRVSMTRRAALPRRREKRAVVGSSRPFCALTTKYSNPIGCNQIFLPRALSCWGHTSIKIGSRHPPHAAHITPTSAGL